MFWNANTGLYDQDTFYRAFTKDLLQAQSKAVIESPFITTNRLNHLLPYIEKLSKRGVQIIVNTKPFEEHENSVMQKMAYEGVAILQQLSVEVLMTVGHHRKLAIIDEKIVWEGSLNILSQSDSCEIMRRIDSEQLARQMIKFIGLDRLHRVK